MNNKDRAVFISGGGSGLGAAVARLLAESGWRVGIAGRRQQALDESLAALRAAGHDGVAYSLDVADAAASAEAIRDFSPDALVNAAAVLGQGTTPQDLSPADFARVQAINVNGCFHCCHAAMQLWREQGRGGDIVNISSLAGIRGMQAFPGFAAYAASKHAVVGLTEALAHDGKALDVRVNAIAPGMMRTAMLAELGITPETLPEQVAPTVAFLLDRRASGPITGTTIEIHCND